VMTQEPRTIPLTSNSYWINEKPGGRHLEDMAYVGQSGSEYQGRFSNC
jgi:hypothetical protein